MLTRENYEKVKLIRQRIEKRKESIKDLQREIEILQRVQKERIAALSVDFAQLDEISNEEIEENNNKTINL
jgi:nicotinate-nucleotide pyrophosphorylase